MLINSRHRSATHMVRPAALIVLIALLAGGCATSSNGPAEPTLVQPAAVDTSALAMFDGRTQLPIEWNELLERIGEADVIILGEQHDDAVAHAVQLAVVREVLDLWPDSAVALEMLERDEQALVDDYFDGVIDQPTFAEETGSSAWAGPGSWAAWYQPIIDAAKEADARVIAANAPRRYVSFARTDGYEPLQSLDANRRELFDLPGDNDFSAYRAQFDEAMGGHNGDSAHAMPTEMMDTFFRSQLVWDATMAASIAQAQPSTERKVVLLVGQFHSDFDGGTVQELRRLLPAANVLTISMQRAAAASLREDDRDRADVVVYTD